MEVHTRGNDKKKSPRKRNAKRQNGSLRRPEKILKERGKRLVIAIRLVTANCIQKIFPSLMKKAKLLDNNFLT